MGDFESNSEIKHTTNDDKYRLQIIIILMALIAFLAPFAVNGYSAGYSFYLNITAMLWSFSIGEYSYGFQFITIYASLAMIPFLMFRLAFVWQIARYYQGKTTRRRTAFMATLSEAPILAIYVLMFFTFTIYGGWGLNFPLPLMMIVGLIILWRFPVSEATVPWEGVSEPIPWWEEQSIDKPGSSSDDQPS